MVEALRDAGLPDDEARELLAQALEAKVNALDRLAQLLREIERIRGDKLPLRRRRRPRTGDQASPTVE